MYFCDSPLQKKFRYQINYATQTTIYWSIYTYIKKTKGIRNRRATGSKAEKTRVRAAQARLSETVEQRKARLEANRVRTVRSRRTLQVDLKFVTVQYDANYDYSHHPSVVIGKMDKLCEYCGALKFKNETPGMCCADGKVKLPELHSPPEPLSTLVSGDTSQSKHFLTNIRKYNSCFQMTSFGATNIVFEN